MEKNGFDNVEFMISTNPGESVKTIGKRFASGGELSRIMLAISQFLQQKTILTQLIFDEIDTGISGQTAMKVAEKNGLKSAEIIRLYAFHICHRLLQWRIVII